MQTCSTTGCEKKAAPDRKGLCYACAKWKQRHPGKTRRPAGEYGLKVRDRLRKVALEYANAETEEEYNRTKDRLVRYASKLARHRIDELIEKVTRRVIRQLAGHPEGFGKVSRSKQTIAAPSKATTEPHGERGTDTE